ncbi:hypothetical protein N7463_009862 [Penicillium fimorum]|uniref:DUF7779 domain-containing protein n=1 Tax=Penicillium fimorum TaxID=1882269 RepID=A0A9W9XJN5_9EURO|nr:hypothetical protein N7463_009862 [Penicillium fimorum]
MTTIKFGERNSRSQVGINNGVINIGAEQLELRPDPLSIVPVPHDPDFVSRDDLLDRISRQSSVPGSRIVLVGLGGVGKTRLAVEYCHQVREQSPDTWVFWVHASNAARCEESLRDIAERTKIPGRRDRNSNIFQLFGNWLQDGKIGEWILVLDNLDDDELLRKPLVTGTEDEASTQNRTSTQPPLKYLLESSNGSIIVTSRNRRVALEIAGHMKNLIDVQPMIIDEAIVLLQKKLDCGIEREDLVRLVEELEFMPLAIVQAASYITHHSSRCSVSQYLEKLRQSDRQTIKLLHHEGYHTHRDWEAKNSILLTWQISFDYIRRTRQSAADLLSLMSFFDRQGIPEELLRVQSIDENHGASGSPKEIVDSSSEEDTDSSSEDDLDDDFETDINTLKDYSFIAISESSMIFTMHRLVQLTVRTWLKTHGQDEERKERFISNLYAKFPTGEYGNWERCRSLFPHVKSAISNRPKSTDSRQNWATLLYRGAWYAGAYGNISDSREMAYLSRKERMKINGAEDEKTLDSTAILAQGFRLEGRWKEAEQLEVQVMETRMTKLGVDHPSTLTSMANLASTYRNQGRWEEAEQLEVQVMETRMTKLGVDHPSTLTSMANLASTYWNQGRWEEAEQLFIQVIETSKTKLGVDHPDTLTSMANLASTYRNQGRWEEAEQLEVQVMETSKMKLGVDHPSTLTSMANLASTYWNQGRWEEAEQLFIQVIETSKTKLGVDHPDTLTSMANLASTYRNQGRWEEAEQLEVQVMETSKMKLGVDHPSTLTSMANLASTYWNQGRWEEAEQLFIQVIETSKTKLGVDHPDTLTSMANLASTYRNQGRWEEAEQLEVQVMETSKMKLGVDHPSTLTSMANLASTYWNQGRWEEAEQLFIQVIETSKTKLGVDHPDTLTSMANLASTYRNQGRWEEAEQLEVQVMETRKTKLGVDHPSTLTSMANLASTYQNQGRWEEAKQLEVQVMETRMTKLGVDHPSTLTSMANLASTYRNQGRWEEAEQLEVQVMETRKTKLGVDHPRPMGRGGAALYTGYRDEQDEARRGPS